LRVRHIVGVHRCVEQIQVEAEEAALKASKVEET
jgi:hypothetical protein